MNDSTPEVVQVEAVSEGERRNELRRVQNRLQWLWTRIENCEALNTPDSLSEVATRWAEYHTLEPRETELIRTGQMVQEKTP